MLKATVHRFAGAVAGAGRLEVGQYVADPPGQGAAEQLDQPGGTPLLLRVSMIEAICIRPDPRSVSR